MDVQFDSWPCFVSFFFFVDLTHVFYSFNKNQLPTSFLKTEHIMGEAG